jgi:putative flippase GtrA
MKRELAVFVVVGVLTVFVDFVSYRALIGFDVLPVDMAKAAGFLTGSLFAYFANRFWTFGHKQHAPGSVWRFVVLYTSTLGTNVLINSLALHMLADAVGAIQIAFVFATGVSAGLNFLGMKKFVFRSRLNSELA